MNYIERLLSRKFPIGIQNFESLRRENYLYVDKSELIYLLANSGKPCFLARPHRFGKSLLISTLDAYFSGKKELFEGLAINRYEKEWKKYLWMPKSAIWIRGWWGKPYDPCLSVSDFESSVRNRTLSVCTTSFISELYSNGTAFVLKRIEI